MKKSLIILFVLTFVLTIPNTSTAQAFGGKGSKAFLIGLGGSNNRVWYPTDGVGVKGSFRPMALNLGFQAEFGIHDYVGLGAFVGLTNARIVGNNWQSLSIPIGMIGNFHFLQLIADKTGGSFAEDMDVYAGLAFGGGPSFSIPKFNNNNGGDVGYTTFGEFRVGIRYYFGPKIGVFAEVAQGLSSRFQAGLALKF